jgi:phospholipid N-methyltransferase
MENTRLQTAIKFARNLFTTGAFMETSRGVELEICRHLPAGAGKVIVEYGLGHGNISREILSRIAPDSRLYSFEVNKEFCDYVKEHIHDERLVVVNDSAANLAAHVPGAVDAFVSSIPFTFLPRELGDEIIRLSYEKLASGGYFSQVLYSGFHFRRFKNVFDESGMKLVWHLPLEFIYHCRKKAVG